MSPEGLAYAMDEYVKSLKHQILVAEAFFFGRIQEAMQKIQDLPEDTLARIDQLVFDVSRGESLDPTDKESRQIVASAIMHSLEERMGY